MFILIFNVFYKHDFSNYRLKVCIENKNILCFYDIETWHFHTISVNILHISVLNFHQVYTFLSLLPPRMKKENATTFTTTIVTLLWLLWLHISWPSAIASAKLLWSCQTLCDPMDHRMLGSSVQGIIQARILEWVAISSSTRSS